MTTVINIYELTLMFMCHESTPELVYATDLSQVEQLVVVVMERLGDGEQQKRNAGLEQK